MALKFDYIFQGPFAGISCSWNLRFPCTRSLCSTVACRWIPSEPCSRHQCCGQALQNQGQDTEDIQRLSFLDMVMVTLARYHRSKTSRVCWAQPHQFFEKILQSVYSAMSSIILSCLAFGEPSLPLTTFHAQTNPPSVNKWLSTLRHPAQAPRCSHQELCIDGVPSGAGPTRSRSCFAWIHIDLVTLVSLWRHCHLLSAEFQTTHFLVRLAVKRARRTLHHTSIAFVPRYFFAGTRHGRKWWLVRRQAGLGNIFRPWRGHI